MLKILGVLTHSDRFDSSLPLYAETQNSKFHASAGSNLRSKQDSSVSQPVFSGTLSSSWILRSQKWYPAASLLPVQESWTENGSKMETLRFFGGGGVPAPTVIAWAPAGMPPPA